MLSLSYDPLIALGKITHNIESLHYVVDKGLLLENISQEKLDHSKQPKLNAC